jgi:hypothetical protein
MQTIETPRTIDPDADAIIESLVSGRPLDPAIRDRVRAEGRRLMEEIRKQHGQLGLAVDLIREGRDE